MYRSPSAISSFITAIKPIHTILHPRSAQVAGKAIPLFFLSLRYFVFGGARGAFFSFFFSFFFFSLNAPFPFPIPSPKKKDTRKYRPPFMPHRPHVPRLWSLQQTCAACVFAHRPWGFFFKTRRFELRSGYMSSVSFSLFSSLFLSLNNAGVECCLACVVYSGMVTRYRRGGDTAEGSGITQLLAGYRRTELRLYIYMRSSN